MANTIVAESAPAAPIDPVAPATPRRTSSWPIGHKISFAALLLITAGLYLWNLSASGYANSFYAAAAQAGSQNWEAFLFGSLDASNAITVDKPPASLWLMALSVRIFGLSSWSILVPQALLGVGSVALLYLAVRRVSGHAAGLLAGVILALTPAAALMFRFDNPDALLVFLLTAAGYVVLRATERASGRLLALAGVLVGLGFLTKMLQAFLVLPAFVLVYLIAADTPVRRRLLHLLGAFAAMIISLGWWVALVELLPASMRPYVGGSNTNSIVELIFGYNGLSRIFGSGGGPGGGGGGGAMGQAAGLTRLVDGISAGMIGWLLPAALILAVIAFVIIGRAARTDLRRAALLLWSGWLLVTGLVFSLMEGTYHDYYTVALAPAVAGLLATAVAVLWPLRTRRLPRLALVAALVVTTIWGVLIVNRAAEPYVWLAWLIGIAGGLAAVGLLLGPRLPVAVSRGITALALVGALAGPAAYTVQTVITPHSGSIVTAGPAVAATGGNGFGPVGPGASTRQGFPNRQGGGIGGGQGGGMAGGPGGGGFGQTGQLSAELSSLLTSDASSYRWVAATVGSQSSARYQLATELPVMAIGGFTGGDPSPTLAEFQGYVAAGQIHYFLASDQGGGRRGPGGRGTATEISAWVSENFTGMSVGGVTVYDLSSAAR